MWCREDRKKRINLADMKCSELLHEFNPRDKNNLTKQQTYSKTDLEKFVPRRVEEHMRFSIIERKDRPINV